MEPVHGAKKVGGRSIEIHSLHLIHPRNERTHVRSEHTQGSAPPHAAAVLRE